MPLYVQTRARLALALCTPGYAVSRRCPPVAAYSTGMSRRWVFWRLKQLADRGEAVQIWSALSTAPPEGIPVSELITMRRHTPANLTRVLSTSKT